MEVSWIGVLVAAASAFVLGGIWYGPLFGKKWLAYNGMTEEDAQTGHPGVIYGGGDDPVTINVKFNELLDSGRRLLNVAHSNTELD